MEEADSEKYQTKSMYLKFSTSLRLSLTFQYINQFGEEIVGEVTEVSGWGSDFMVVEGNHRCSNSQSYMYMYK